MTHIDSARKTRRYSFVAYADQIEVLDKLAAAKDTNPSVLIREAITAYLKAIKEDGK